MNCLKCGRTVTADEIAATKKLVNRKTTVSYCTDCLAKAFDVRTQDIQNKIRYWKEIGCTLFS